VYIWGVTTPKSKTRSKRKAPRKPKQAPKQAPAPEDPSPFTTQAAEKHLLDRPGELRDETSADARASEEEFSEFVEHVRLCHETILQQAELAKGPRAPTQSERLEKLETTVEALALDLGDGLESLSALHGGFERMEAALSNFRGMHPRDIPSSCSNCRFFAAAPTPDRWGIRRNYVEGQPKPTAELTALGEHGACRRHPPAPQVGFPRAHPTSWCGDWEA
jgi:hypothetical protein